MIVVSPNFHVSFLQKTPTNACPGDSIALKRLLMNPLDNLVPPDPVFLEEEEEAQLQRYFLLLQARDRREAVLRRQRMRVARREVDMSSDSDTEGLPSQLNGKMNLTPANSTPQEKEKEKEKELVKLDPSEIGKFMLSSYPSITPRSMSFSQDFQTIGMSVGLKNLYSGKEDKRGRFQWQTNMPEDLGKPAEDAESEKWAIIVRNVKVYNDPKKVLSLHSIVIQSPLLKDLLKEVLAGYPGVTVGLKRLEFSGRFEPLIHRFSDLKKAISKLKAEGETSAEKRKHAELLHDLLAKEFKDSIDAAIDMESQGVMTYEHLWTLFQPGSFVYSRQQGQDRIFRLHSSKYGQDRNGNPVYWLTCQYVDYDGSRFGTNKLNVCIAIYDGTRPISNLPTLPLEFHPNKEELKDKLMERGGKVESFAGSHYRGYNGIGWRLGNMGVKEKYSIKGRIGKRGNSCPSSETCSSGY